MQTSKAESIFSADGKTTEILRSWWKRLDANRGGRAELRRTASPSDVVYAPVYHELVRDFSGHGQAFSREKLAAVAGLAARVKTDTGEGVSFSAQMATPRSAGGGAAVSGLRFRRLIAVNDPEELFPLIVRTLNLLDGKVNLADLARAIYWWNDSTKKRWAYDYYAAAPSEK